MINIISNKEKEFSNEKNKKKKKERNISYNDIFNYKPIKINLFKGDNIKISNDELETKINLSISKKNNSILYTSLNRNYNTSNFWLNSNDKKYSNTFNKNFKINSVKKNIIFLIIHNHLIKILFLL